MAKQIFPLTPNLTLISNEPGNLKVLDKRTGAIVKVQVPDALRINYTRPDPILSEIISYFNKSSIDVQNLEKTVELVTSVDSKIIDFYLKTSDGTLEPKVGFLVEIFESGSDGKLTRLFQEDLKDPVDDNNVLEDGFTNYFTIEVDVSNGR